MADREGTHLEKRGEGWLSVPREHIKAEQKLWKTDYQPRVG